MQKTEPFTFGNYYHVYNRGINGCNIFKENENYNYFLKLYNEHVSSIADTYAWVLMPNHFHLLVRVKEEGEISSQQNCIGGGMFATPSQKMANLFNAYAQAFNKRYNRHGGLFERPFKRKHIQDIEYLRNTILYIHDNPIHHQFCDHLADYKWSSYFTCISDKPTLLKRDAVIEWFDDTDNFKFMHQQKVQVEEIEKWLELQE